MSANRSKRCIEISSHSFSRLIEGSTNWDDYRFYHWAGIDYFCYFSSQYISIPPLPWINAAHHNGVPILATFTAANDSDGNRLFTEVLETEEKMLQIVDCLVAVTERFCFDGWLLNIKCDVDSENMKLLHQFVRECTKRIHEKIPDGKVFWYDSVVESGSAICQNELNEDNSQFFDESDGILINYDWNNLNLEESTQILTKNPEALSKVFVGVDIFGRSMSQAAKFESFETLKKVKKYDFSIGIFAPAWAYWRTLDIGLNPSMEHNREEQFQQFLVRDKLLWMLLWRYLYTSGPTTLPFYTSFCMGSGRLKFDGGNPTAKPWFNLTEQQYQPSVSTVYEYNLDDGFRGGMCLDFRRIANHLRLFVTYFDCEHDIIVSYAYRSSSPNIYFDLILKIVNNDGRNLIVKCGDDSAAQSDPVQKSVPLLNETNLNRVIDGLNGRKESVLSCGQSEHGDWLTRFYYLKFHPDVKSSRIVDVGVSIACKDEWSKDYSIKLGALHIHSGIVDDEVVDIATEAQIHSQDFDE